MEQIKAMLEEISKGGAFASEMQDLIAEGNNAEIVAVAGKRGFVFKGSDWQGYLDWCGSLSGGGHVGELEEADLADVSGGSGGDGSRQNPYVSDCWFHASGAAENQYGAMRKKCNQFACCAQNFVGPGGGPNPDWKKWYQCGCHGTDHCVWNWHRLDTCGNTL